MRDIPQAIREADRGSASWRYGADEQLRAGAAWTQRQIFLPSLVTIT
jgi:hypothetical protein